jgi:FKBP-type peptidyl-prolyl cis-trans isomerase
MACLAVLLLVAPLHAERRREEASASASIADARANRAAAQAFLAENGQKPGVVTTRSGLQYRVVRQGEGASPAARARVTVHYRGKLLDGREFDSSYARNRPATLPLNAVIKGWQEALQLMNKGSVYELYVPADLAYGDQALPGIPPGSLLRFEVELLDFDRAR